VGLLKIFFVAFLYLLVSDFISTFCYHVPEHIFGKFHAIIHHSPNRSFVRYAFSSGQHEVLITGFLSAFPYILLIPIFGYVSLTGTIIGLILALAHVEWRHLSETDWKTPKFVQRICQFFYITTPERHRQHHRNSRVAYGDIFTFFEQPAQAWFKLLIQLKKKVREKYS
jgi:hypothetical protein